ncbi:MAG: nucleoside phosphorylase [Okeania sp. SIO3C4]|nr:nucleoside phosphorylase [Okeania sp. SIO3C4]
MKQIGASELIINEDGSIFHLHLKPEEIADTIILVGDQGRVEMVSNFFDTVETKRQSREFITHTGTLNGKRISAVSTGIGTDNIDIVLNELDALVNIDFETRTPKAEHTTLKLVRIGTSGALQDDMEPNTPVLSAISSGFDGMLNFYRDRNKVARLDIEKAFLEHTNWNSLLATPYFVESSATLSEKIGPDMLKGITISAPGFYGPQGRELRLPIVDSEMNAKLSAFSFDGLKVTNYEMESSALFGLSKLLGHEAATVCNVIANRKKKAFGGDYKTAIRNLIEVILGRLTND